MKTVPILFLVDNIISLPSDSLLWIYINSTMIIDILYLKLVQYFEKKL